MRRNVNGEKDFHPALLLGGGLVVWWELSPPKRLKAA
jgi:hypothetical protein